MTRVPVSRPRPAVLGIIAALLLSAVAAADPPSFPAQRVVQPDARIYNYEIVADAAVAFPELILENTGESPVGDISLVADDRDLTTLDGILATILRPGMSDEQRARAIWEFARTQTYAWWPYSDFSTESHDPVRHVNSYAYGFCSDFTNMMTTMYLHAGFRVRRWHPGSPPAHVVPEVYFDGGWHAMDAHRDILFLGRDNRTIASVQELVLDPWLVERAGPRYVDLAAIYQATPLDAYVEASTEASSSTLRYRLRPRERLWFPATPLGWFRNDTVQASQPPPLYGNAVLSARVEAEGDGVLALLEPGHSLRQVTRDGVALLSTLQDAPRGEALYRVATPHPLVAASAKITAHVGAPGDKVTLYAGRASSSVALDEALLASGRAFLHPAVIEASGLLTCEEDGLLPAAHVDGMSEGRLVLRVRRASDLPLILGARFYRWSPSEVLGIDVSPDGASWTPAYVPDSGQLGYFDAVVDATALVAGWTEVFVRIRLVPVLYGTWAVGLAGVWVDGVVIEPADEVASFTAPGTSMLEVDLSSIVAPSRGPAYYEFALRAVVESAGGASGLVGLDTTSIMQVAPWALPHPHRGNTPFRLEVREGSPSDLQVRHAWTETPAPGPLPPVAPLAPADHAVTALGAELLFAWVPASGFPASQVQRYEVRLCADQACDTPLTSLLQIGTGIVTAGGDGLIGTMDDLIVDGSMPIVSTPFTSWLTAGRTYYWRVRTQSIAGDWSAFGPIWSFTPAAPSAAPPALVIEAPSSDATVTTPLVTLAGTVSAGAAPVTVRWTTDRGQSGVVTATSAWQTAGVPVAGGTTRVVVTATDASGNTVAATTSYVVPYISYLMAEGTTNADFRTEIVVANPTGGDARVDVHFLTESGGDVRQSLTVGALRRVTVVANDLPQLAAQSFGIEVRSLDAVPLAVERAVFWGADREAGHSAAAAPGLSQTWYFAEGAQGFFDTFVLLANPQETAALATVSFLTEHGLVVQRQVEVPARGRFTLWTRAVPELAHAAFSIAVLANRPIVAERAMYFGSPGWIGGHAGPGLQAPGTRWFSAEGVTGSYFDTYLLLGNPSPERTAHVNLRFLSRDGGVYRRGYEIAPATRLTVNAEIAHPALADAEFSTVIDSDVPVVAERATYWGGAFPNWLDAHAAPAAAASYVKWGLADARVGGAEAFETWVLIANEDPVRAAQVEMTFLTEEGAPVSRTVTVAPNSRYSVWLEQDVPELTGRRAGLRLESANGVPIVVERAMYWSTPRQAWAGGSSAPGAPLP